MTLLFQRLRAPASGLLFFAACTTSGGAGSDSVTATAMVAEATARANSAAGVTTASSPQPPAVGRDLGALRWIAGDWRGQGTTQAPFYERYRFADDSTLLVDGFADSTFATVTETTRFRMRAGIVTSAPGASGEPPSGTPQYVATALSADSVRFDPLVKVRNSFVWRRTSADEWRAVILHPASDTRPAQQVTYVMRRWKQSK